jgi:hypothetical protein
MDNLVRSNTAGSRTPGGPRFGREPMRRFLSEVAIDRRSGMGQHSTVAVLIAAAFALTALVLQLGIIRPSLNRRTARVLAGETIPRSRFHLAYVAAEGVKVLALLGLGVLLLA